MNSSGKKIALTDLCLYFEGEARDRLERNTAARREGELLVLKDRLLRLDEREYDAAIQTLRRFVERPQPQRESPEERSARKYREAAQLFEKAQEGAGTAASPKVEPV